MKYDAVDAGGDANVVKPYVYVVDTRIFSQINSKVTRVNLYRGYLEEENLKVRPSKLVLEVLYANRGSLSLLFPVTLTPDPQNTLFILV